MAMGLRRHLLNEALSISITLIMLIGATTVVCTSCGAQAESGNMTIVDSAEREVQIKYPIDRVVLLTADNCEMAVVLDALDKVVGAEKGASSFAEIGEMFGKAANVGSSQEPDLEKIVNLNPDVVLGYKSSVENGVADELEGMGIPFVVCECNRIQTFEKDVELMGRILSKEENAKDFLAFHNSIIDLIEERTSNIGSDQRTSLYLTGGGTTFGKDSGIDLYLSVVGAKSIGSELAGESSVTVDPEWVLAQDPQVIIHWITSSKIKPTPDPLIEVKDAYLNDSVLNMTTAVEDGRVHVIGWRLFKGLRFSIGLLYWAKWCHPDLFQDIDPEEYNREYAEKFLGIDLENVWAL
jgi:iron complex transport system substrate-binding protein